MVSKKPKVVYLEQPFRHRIEKLLDKNMQIITTSKSPSIRMKAAGNIGKARGILQFMETPHGRRAAIRASHKT